MIFTTISTLPFATTQHNEQTPHFHVGDFNLFDLFDPGLDPKKISWRRVQTHDLLNNEFSDLTIMRRDSCHFQNRLTFVSLFNYRKFNKKNRNISLLKCKKISSKICLNNSEKSPLKPAKLVVLHSRQVCDRLNEKGSFFNLYFGQKVSSEMFTLDFHSSNKDIINKSFVFAFSYFSVE